MNKALIIIDMQVMPFIWKEYGGKDLYRREVLLENVKGLIAKAREAEAPIYYILYTERGDSPRAEGQPLWHVYPEVAPLETDHLIIKYNADSFHNTELDGMLKDSGIENVVLCGVQTEYCVDTTCRSSFTHGYHMELAADGHSTFDSNDLKAEQIIRHHNAVLSIFGEVKPSDQISFK
ncbi:MAG: cysteine hydrolase family protein [Bacillota bacterium]